MANSIVRNPIFIDTWSADIVISDKPFLVEKIVLFSAAAGDLLYLEDKNGNQVDLIVTKVNAQETEHTWADGFRFDGLQIDVSDCTGLGSGDKCWIFLKSV